MKINDPNRINQIRAYQQPNRVKEQQGVAPSQEKQRDEISISKEALSMAKNIGTDNDAERAERIASVKKAIQSGTYQVEIGAVINKLLDEYEV